MLLSAIKTMAVQARPANGKARIAFEQELLFLTRCHPRCGCSFSFASERQGQGGLLLVVSRGRCHVDEECPRTPGLVRAQNEGCCNPRSSIDHPTARVLSFSMASLSIKS